MQLWASDWATGRASEGKEVTNQLDLLLVNPGGRREIYQDLCEDLTFITMVGTSATIRV